MPCSAPRSAAAAGRADAAPDGSAPGGVAAPGRETSTRWSSAPCGLPTATSRTARRRRRSSATGRRPCRAAPRARPPRRRPPSRSGRCGRRPPAAWGQRAAGSGDRATRPGARRGWPGARAAGGPVPPSPLPGPTVAQTRSRSSQVVPSTPAASPTTRRAAGTRRPGRAARAGRGATATPRRPRRRAGRPAPAPSTGAGRRARGAADPVVRRVDEQAVALDRAGLGDVEVPPGAQAAHRLGGVQVAGGAAVLLGPVVQAVGGVRRGLRLAHDDAGPERVEQPGRDVVDVAHPRGHPPDHRHDRGGADRRLQVVGGDPVDDARA